MFTHLVASRPTMDRGKPGFLFSLLMHGMTIAAAVLLTAPRSDLSSAPDGPREITLPPMTLQRPEPAPQAPAPARTITSPPQAPTLAIETPLVPPLKLSSTIPEAWTTPWSPVTSPTYTGGGASGGGPADGSGAGVPFAGPSGAFALAQVDVPAALDPRSPLPRYPDGLRAWRSEGVARLRFIVDTLGRVEQKSVEVLESSHPAFTASVRATLPRMRFRPARIGARAVRQLVEFPITFRLEP